MAENLSHGPRAVGTLYAHHVDQRHGEVGFAQHLYGAFGVGHHDVHDAEVGRLGHGEGLHVDAVGPQQPGHLADAARLVLEKQ